LHLVQYSKITRVLPQSPDRRLPSSPIQLAETHHLCAFGLSSSCWEPMTSPMLRYQWREGLQGRSCLRTGHCASGARGILRTWTFYTDFSRRSFQPLSSAQELVSVASRFSRASQSIVSILQESGRSLLSVRRTSTIVS
jgi:hypothetical protein